MSYICEDCVHCRKLRLKTHYIDSCGIERSIKDARVLCGARGKVWVKEAAKDMPYQRRTDSCWDYEEKR